MSKKPNVKEHISMFIRYTWNFGKRFRTRQIQELSVSGEKKFGYRLGSPDTYTRTFRKMKEDGDFKVRIHRYNKLSNFMNKKTDALWVLEDHNL